MTFQARNYFALNSIAARMRNFLESVILAGICLVLVAVAVMYYATANYTRIMCDRTLNGGIKNTGTIFVNSFVTATPEEINEFEENVYQSEYIDAAGGNFYVFDHKPIRGEAMYSAMALIDQYDEITAISGSLLPYREATLCNAKIQSGSMPLADVPTYMEANDFENHIYHIPIYLGASYAHIPVGATYTEREEIRGVVHTWTYEVVGIFEPNACWLSDSMMWDVSLPEAECVQVLDDLVLIFYDGSSLLNALKFTLADDHTMQETVDFLYALAEEMDMDITVSSFAEDFAVAERQINTLLRYIFQVLVIVLIVTLISVPCQQIVLIYNKRREYGIMYAMGASKTDISYMFIFENVLRMILSTVFALAFASWYMRSNLQTYGTAAYAIDILIGQFMIPATIGMALILLIISSVVPIWIFHHYQPVQFIGGERM